MKFNPLIARFILVVISLVGVVSIFSYIGPTKVVEVLGFENVYLTVFIFAIVGGVSAFTAATFYATVFSLALGGANPFILALFSAPGVLIGDFIFWYFGIEGRKLIESGYGQDLNKFTAWLQAKPKWFAPVFIYIYTGLTPFPGDFIMFALALMKYRFSQILIPTLLGNYTLALIVSLSAQYGVQIGWF